MKKKAIALAIMLGVVSWAMALEAADIEAVLDDAAGSSALSVKDLRKDSYASVDKISSGVVAGTKFFEVDNNSLSRLTNVAGKFSRAIATWIESMGLRLVSAWIWLAESIVMSLGTRIFNSLLILIISFSICALAILVLTRRKERSSIRLMMLAAPFTFLDWIASRIFSTAGHNGFPLRDSFSWLSQLIKTSVSRNIKLDSAIICVPEGANDFNAAFAPSQGGFKFTGQGLDDIRLFGSLAFVKEWSNRRYRILECRAHDSYLLLAKEYHKLRKKSIQYVILFSFIILCAASANAADIEAVLDDAAGSSALSVKDLGSVEQASISSDGNMVIKNR